jgi:DNA-binding transcriptional ArsR family regulator
VALLAQVFATGAAGYMPDLLTPKPPPGGPDHALACQLERVRETPGDQVVWQLTRESFRNGRMPTEVRRAMESGTFARRAANGLHRFWRTVMADRWSGVRAALESDLAGRIALMGGQGVGALLDSLHPCVTWTGNHIKVNRPIEGHLDLRDTELVLCPTVLGWPWLAVQVTDPADAMLFYPATGVGGASRLPSRALHNLVGASRAAVLRDLDVPRSTAELSRRHSLAPATVSYHLGVLLRAGLVRRSRERHHVLYQRNEQGDALL